MNPLVARLRVLHDKVKRGSSSEAEEREYDWARSQLGRVLLVAQQMGQQGETLRSPLRMASVVKVEIVTDEPLPEKTATIDLAQSGFAALLRMAQPPGRTVGFVLHLAPIASATGPVRGTARVATSRPHGALHRVSFTFVALTPEHRRHLEMAIIDAVLSRFPAA